MKAYFSFFPVMAVVLMAYFLLSVYSANSAMLSEADNVAMLVDRLYFTRKNSEYTFWTAAQSGDCGDLLAWQRLTTCKHCSLRTSSWFGGKKLPEDVFSDKQLESSVKASLCTGNPLKGLDHITTLSCTGTGNNFISQHTCSQIGQGWSAVELRNPGDHPYTDPAFETVILSEEPLAATAFVAGMGKLVRYR